MIPSEQGRICLWKCESLNNKNLTFSKGDRSGGLKSEDLQPKASEQENYIMGGTDASEDDEFYDPMDGSGSERAETIVAPVVSDDSPELDIEDPLLGKDGDDSNDWSPHNSFLADSPYFNAFVENDVKSLSVLVETLQDISARTKTFSKCGALMSESTRRLAFSCRLKRDNDLSEDMTEDEKVSREAKLLKERRRALGNEMADLLELLGEVSSNSLFGRH